MSDSFTLAEASALTGHSVSTVRRMATPEEGEHNLVLVADSSPMRLTAESVLAERARILAKLGAVEPGDVGSAGTVSPEAHDQLVFENRDLRSRVRVLVASHEAMVAQLRVAPEGQSSA